MRPLNYILRDVILQLESIGGAPRWPWEDFGSKSPLGLYMSSPTGDPQTPVLWSPDLDVDTGELIDAAWEREHVVVVRGKGWAEVLGAEGAELTVVRAGTSREAVILALAQALGVETEE